MQTQDATVQLWLMLVLNVLLLEYLKEKGRKEVLLSRRVYREVRAIFRECVFTAVKLRHLGTVTKVQPKHSCRLCEL